MARYKLTVLTVLLLACSKGCYSNTVEEHADTLDIPCTTDAQCTTEVPESTCNIDLGKCECRDNHVLSSNMVTCLRISAGYDEPCEDSKQCSAKLSRGGVCVNNVCECATGYHYLNGNCWRDAALGATCAEKGQCYSSYDTVGLDCVGDVCVCDNGYYQREYTSCRKRVAEDESCLLNADCVGCVNGGVCIKIERKCQCNAAIPSVATIKNRRNVNGTMKIENGCDEESDGQCIICSQGYFLIDGKCYKEVGAACTTSEECSAGVEYAQCVDGVCICDVNVRVSSENRQVCLKGANGEIETFAETSCLQDRQCFVFGDHSICVDRRCACDEDSHWDGEQKMCWVSKRVGEVCVSPKDCFAESAEDGIECKDFETEKKCTCKDGFHVTESGDDCRKDVSGIGDVCGEDFDCNKFDPNTSCRNDTLTCSCKDNFFEESGTCKSGLGASCVNDDNCKFTENAKCVLQEELETLVCECVPGYVNSLNYQTCLPVAGYTETCEEEQQCTESLGELSNCVNLQCACNTDAYYKDGQCFLRKKLGEKCEKEGECYQENDPNSAMCENGYCTCKYGYIPVSDLECSSGVQNSAQIVVLMTFIYVIRNMFWTS